MKVERDSYVGKYLIYVTAVDSTPNIVKVSRLLEKYTEGRSFPTSAKYGSDGELGDDYQEEEVESWEDMAVSLANDK